ncbi:MAG: helix-turn-helix transcriptional regulator [Armatimonadetes bacterium]|nr:helix-turn-helix transcriptional regulator [Armatimonadota bacterium]
MTANETKPVRTEKGLRRKTEIMDTAARLIHQQGFNRTSLEEDLHAGLIRHPEATGEEHILPIPALRERTRFAHQPVQDMSMRTHRVRTEWCACPNR